MGRERDRERRTERNREREKERDRERETFRESVRERERDVCESEAKCLHFTCWKLVPVLKESPVP